MESFTPQHAQPVTLAQLNQLEPSILTTEIARLNNSITHLKRSNDELDAFCRPSTSGGGAQPGADEEELDEESKAELQASIQENLETIASQEERLEMIRIALQNQIGVDSTNSHYAPNSITPPSFSSPPSAPPTAASLPPPSASTNGLVNGVTDGDDAMADVDDGGGMYL